MLAIGVPLTLYFVNLVISPSLLEVQLGKVKYNDICSLHFVMRVYELIK